MMLPAGDSSPAGNINIEPIEIANKLLLLHLVGCLYYYVVE